MRELTPETSYGFAVIDFARDILGEPLLPWQAWLVIHMGELLEDGTPRFRTLLILVARQNGKTHLLKVLALYWLFVEMLSLIVGISTKVEYAKESWKKAVQMAQTVPALAEEMPKKGGVRLANGDELLETAAGCRYKIAAASRTGGRSLTIDRLIIDEIREHQSWEAWDAAEPATSAVPWAQVICISNMGDDKSVVLNDLHANGLKTLDPASLDPEDEYDESLGMFEWSAVEGAELMDRFGWASANPALGYMITEKTMRSAAVRAKNGDPRAEAGFRTERLCQRVRSLDAAIDPEKWNDCIDISETLAQMCKRLRAKPSLCVDVSIDGLHSTIAGAVMGKDGKVRVEVVWAAQGPDATQQMVDKLPDIIKAVRPRAVGWFPNGPAAGASAGIVGGRAAAVATSVGAKLEQIKMDTAAVCMGMAEQVRGVKIMHGNEDLLNAHVLSVSRLKSTNDSWKFSRKGGGHSDAAYAGAGAIHLARTGRGNPKALIATSK